MFLIDSIALSNPAARLHPGEKVLPVLAGLVLALAAPSAFAAAVLCALFAALGFWLSALRLRRYLAVLAAPASFIAAGAFGLAVGLAVDPPASAFTLDLGAFSLYWTHDSLRRALLLGLRSLAASTALLALMLSTSAIDLLWLAGRVGLPAFLVELASLTYRYIAVLWESAEKIRLAQECRLGYRSLAASFRSLGLLGASTFRIAWLRSEASWIALRARGCEGSLCVRSRPRRFRLVPVLVATAAICALGLVLFAKAPR